jgi:hypothetical protein
MHNDEEDAMLFYDEVALMLEKAQKRSSSRKLKR